MDANSIGRSNGNDLIVSQSIELRMTAPLPAWQLGLLLLLWPFTAIDSSLCFSSTTGVNCVIAGLSFQYCFIGE